MPCDDPVALGLAALAKPIAAFRAVLRDALTQGERLLEAQTAGADRRAERAAAELGPFAASRIDPERFAALVPDVRRVGDAERRLLERALAVLREALDRGDALFLVDVPSGGSLGGVLRGALAALGRGLGAATLVELLRSGRLGGDGDALLAPVGFPAWSSAARRIAPPLLIVLDGGDLRGGALAEFTDGREKMVLVTRGACPPAPLARCITPGTLVLQTADGQGLDRFAAFEGPALAAIVPEGAATFLHDPDAGREAWQRLALWRPGDAPVRGLSGESAWQMDEERKLLLELARTPFAVPGPRGATPASGAADAVDRIASWLIGQSELPGS